MRCGPGCQLEIPAPSEHPPEQADNRSQLPVAALDVAVRERYDLDLDHECVGRATVVAGFHLAGQVGSSQRYLGPIGWVSAAGRPGWFHRPPPASVLTSLNPAARSEAPPSWGSV